MARSRAEHLRMIAKKFALAFGIAVVFPAMIRCGVSKFSQSGDGRPTILHR